MDFVKLRLTPGDCWRGIIMFGRNVASYKFALARSLLELDPNPGDLIRLEDLAPRYAQAICEHLREIDRQSTSRGSRFLDACRAANRNELSHDRLRDTTVQLGFQNVIDAFHTVGPSDVPHRFFADERQTANGIRVLDPFGALRHASWRTLLHSEIEARWRLVETAWSLRVPDGVLSIEHDAQLGRLIATTGRVRRRNVTGTADALSGYQKGHCFYCFRPFDDTEDGRIEVEHFLPFRLASTAFGAAIDQIWNLTLSCTRCNRGPGGKFDRVPAIELLNRLHTRNEFLIESHHPLRETLIRQAGSTRDQRRAFLQRHHSQAVALLIHGDWRPRDQWEPVF